jgi:hypothetical protein
VTKTVDTTARAAFALLVVATVAAFFVTQRLKTGEPAVKDITVQAYMSPNGDGLEERARFAFTLPHGDRVTLDIDDAQGDRVRRLLDGASLRSARHVFYWDGRDDTGIVPRDAHYYLRVVLRDQGRAVTSPTGVLLVTRPPRPRIVSVSPRLAPARRPAPVTVRFTGPAASPPILRIWRTDRRPAQPVATVPGHRGEHTIRFSGRVHGHPLPPGDYSVSITVRNRALVTGSFPARLPPTREQGLPGTGFTILGTVAAGPLEPIVAGGTARITVEAGERQVRWRLDRLVGSKKIAEGRASHPSFGVRVPRKAATGEYVVSVTAGGRTARVPFAVRSGPSRKVLLVLPATTWQGTNPVDEDADGFSDTLFTARSVPTGRPFAAGRLPAQLSSQTAPLLRFLARRGIHYDLTTDLALARGHAPLLRGHSGVVLAGPETWTTAALGAQLQAYVRAGGRIATFGIDSLQRAVVLTPSALEQPTRPAPDDTFGESLASPTTGPPGAFVARSDRIGLFEGTSGVVGRFRRVQATRHLPAGARPLATAGPDGRHSALVAYRLGRGMVIRFGTPEWTGQLETSAGVATVTERAWSLVSR